MQKISEELDEEPDYENENFDEQDVKSVALQREDAPSKNMTISIHYPIGGNDRALLQPVSIHVDPAGNCEPPWNGDRSKIDPASSSNIGRHRESSSSGYRKVGRVSRSESPDTDRSRKSFETKKLDSPKFSASKSQTDFPVSGTAAAQRHLRNTPIDVEALEPSQKLQALKLVESIDDFDTLRFQKPIGRKPATKYPIMSFSPPRERPSAGNFFSELGANLDRKSSNYLANWDPQGILNPKQRESIEATRQQASHSIVLANRALSGVIDYGDWQRSSKDIGSHRHVSNDETMIAL